ncbi:MAG: DUF5703 domain-containing protein [Pirellulaceae bacterium]
MRYSRVLGFVAVVLLSACAKASGAAEAWELVDQYNVVWDSPSAVANGSMPLGNGAIALNAWVEPSGDLVFYIATTDAWDDNGRLLKVGRVRISLDPSPATSAKFRQTLQLREATLEAVFGDEGQETVVRLWVDANHPVIHATVESPQPVAATARIELWRTAPTPLTELEVSDVLANCPRTDQTLPPIVEPDTVLDKWERGIGWYHHNVKSEGPALTAQIQGVTGFERPDPLLHRTFGAVITADDACPSDKTCLQRPAANSHRFDTYVLTRHPPTPAQWTAAMAQLISDISKEPVAQRDDAHRQWWQRFWNRSWIDIRTDDAHTTESAIPANPHAVRIGADQVGSNRLQGEIGRVSVLDRAVTAAEVAALAAIPAQQPLGSELPALASGIFPIGTDLSDLAAREFPAGITIEAWVKPEQLPGGGGRIVDKVTPGQGDGLLLDSFPGNSLRLIVGPNILHVQDSLPPGQWSHVAAVVDKNTGRMELYLQGKLVAHQEGSGGNDAAVVSQMYALQRFINACAGRGAYPIKFNGSLFTVPSPGRPGDGDYRRWGPGYWWQNTRLPYISMCASGDFEMMRPLFQMYADQLMPLQKYRTKLYLGHDGAYIPECIYFWGDVFTETYGWTPFEQRQDKLQESGWHKWEWVSGLELVWMMLDYYDHTQDPEFLKNHLLPTAHEILTFFDQHYATGEDGKLVMHPAQALETWWKCTNPMPELAGLHAVSKRLRELPADVTAENERAFWTALQAKLPALPTREIDGQLALAPATSFETKNNIENPELYAVFPFRLVAFDKDNADLGRVALDKRTDRGNIGWRQDDVFMAYLGLAEEVRENVVGRARNHDQQSRFPAFWGPNYDWVPDQDHGGILLKAVQSMLLQTDGAKIFLLPAWPAKWDVHFKLHAPYRTVVEGEYRGGKLVNLTVLPESRRSDVVICGAK